MRASGACALEHSLIARPTSPARMHFWMFERNASLLMDDLNRYIDRSTVIATTNTIQKTIGHMPQPPSLKC